MKKDKKAVAAAAVKAASNEAIEVEALSNEVAVQKATKPQRSKLKNAPSKQKTQKAADKSLVHITKDDPEWDDYITGLKKNVDDAIQAGLFNFEVAYIGFVDDKELGYPSLFDSDKMFRVLVTNGYCPECASNYIEALKNNVNGKGQKTDLMVITKEEQEFWCMEEACEERAKQSDVKHMKD